MTSTRGELYTPIHNGIMYYSISSNIVRLYMMALLPDLNNS